MSSNAIKSPCVLVCAIEPVSGHCYGCGRTRDEIGAWTLFTDAQRDSIMTELPARVDKLERKPRRVTRRQRLRGNTPRSTTFETSE